MPCVLWISCDCSSKALIDTLEMQPYKTIEKGSVVATKTGGEKLYEQTLCGFDVSQRDFIDIKGQIQDAIQYLEAHSAQLSRLEKVEGFSAKLDFGIYTQFSDNRILAQYDTIPHQLMKLAGDLKLDLELSQYWYAGEENTQLN
jgi:hypothetical protein